MSAQDLCELYECRPLTCRFYGIPTAIGGQGHTCGLSGFQPGETYPTVNLDVINARLQEISAELVRDLKSRFVKLADMLVPVSTALLTEYDEVYLGREGCPGRGAAGFQEEEDVSELSAGGSGAPQEGVFDSMSDRRQKHILKRGYDKWDPFEEPKHPIDIRKDKTKRTTQTLVREFLQSSTR